MCLLLWLLQWFEACFVEVLGMAYTQYTMMGHCGVQDPNVNFLTTSTLAFYLNGFLPTLRAEDSLVLF
jgi:hypothetical protein